MNAASAPRDGRFRLCAAWTACALIAAPARAAPESAAPVPPLAAEPRRVASDGAAPSPPASEVVRCDGGSAVDVLHHGVEVALQLQPSALAGKGELRVRARSATSSVALDAHGLRMERAAVGGRTLRISQDDPNRAPSPGAASRVCIELPGPVRAGDTVKLKLAWAVAAPGKALHFASDHAWAGYDPAAWMPTVQDSAQRATLSLRLIVPTGLKVAASGRRLASQPLSAAQVAHTFALDRPTPVFLFAFAAGQFDEAELTVEGIQLRALGPAGSDLAGALALTAPMLRFLIEHTGRKPPARQYALVFVAGDAAQEAAAMALLGAQALDDVRVDPQDDWVFSHELAHQWFGWLVPCADFNDFWLNEGFATFIVAATKEARWGRASYEAELAGWRARSARAHEQDRDAPLTSSAPGVPARPTPRDADLPARGITYYRGALVLDKLRRELGDALFWKGIQRYIRDRANQNTRTEQLRTALESVTGRDLKPFFERWVYTAAPDL